MFHVGWRPFLFKIFENKNGFYRKISKGEYDELPGYGHCADCGKKPTSGKFWYGYNFKDWTDCGWEYDETMFCKECAKKRFTKEQLKNQR